LIAAPTSSPNYSALFGTDSVLGNWLRTRLAVLKLGDLLLMHGGISPAILDAKFSIADLNNGIRASLDVPAAAAKTMDVQTQLIAGSDGPQWYRDFSAKAMANAGRRY
jgi:hypothetical protein